MSVTVNKVILLGILVTDPIDNQVNGKSVCNAIVETVSKENRQRTNIVMWSTTAQLFAKYAKKDCKLYIEGYLNTHGSETEVVVSNFVIL